MYRQHMLESVLDSNKVVYPTESIIDVAIERADNAGGRRRRSTTSDAPLRIRQKKNGTLFSLSYRATFMALKRRRFKAPLRDGGPQVMPCTDKNPLRALGLLSDRRLPLSGHSPINDGGHKGCWH